jgi:hypothetical protein
MRVGFSLSPGGLLLPYHVGVLDGLKHRGYLSDEVPIAGASAGAIAVATSACKIDSKLILDDTISISDTCRDLGSARGNLLPLLRQKLENHVDEDSFEAFRERPGEAVVTYQELFPSYRSVHAKEFQNKDQLQDAICYSSSFPFFASNFPVALDHSGGIRATVTLGQKFRLKIPRLVVDGFFAVPGDRWGCPDFELAGVDVDRTIAVTSFPREVIGLKESIAAEDCISPELKGDGIQQCADLLRMATQPTSASEVFELYENGFKDAEKWCLGEEIHWRREKARENKELRRKEE